MANKKYKLANEYWEASGVFDLLQNKTQRDINERAISAINSLAGTGKYKLVAGIIRNTSNGWKFLNDSGHAPVGVTGDPIIDSEDGTFLKINFNFSAKKINSLIVGFDETWGQYFSVGASIADTNARFKIYNLPITQGGLAIYDPNNTIEDTHSNGFTTKFLLNTSSIASLGQGVIEIQTPALPFNPHDSQQFNISANCTTFLSSPQAVGETFFRVLLKKYDGTGVVGADYPTDGSFRLFAQRTIPMRKIYWSNVKVDEFANFFFFGLCEVN